MSITAKFGFSADCKSIREKVFVKEQGFKEEFDDIDGTAVHVVLYDGDIPAATGRAYAVKNTSSGGEAGEYAIGRVAVIKEYRGKHLGSKVISELEGKIREAGGKSVIISSQLQAVEFYRSLGYEPFGGVYFDEHCPHRRMKKSLCGK